MLKGCLGALDGTYIDVRVPVEDRASYRTRKGSVSVNVLGVCDREMCFIYVLAGWEGNYYLVDSGYSNREGFLSPYKGVRYHLKEWDSRRNSLQNHVEFFNMKHASARDVIERTFELLKARWPFSEEMTIDPIEQVLTDEGFGEEDSGEYLGTVDSNPIWNTWRDEMAKSIYNEWRGIS
ncbi:UNVERIFIED_CONTAM: hypothetical protein Sradi_0467800 [Sesamum radiatum]|uniref:DDE Tnp4 domain-containing protein n=1 Tax=Sesamum radiatum TaxID=300843 RepID=A0AAW2W772_SESRA